MSSAASQPAQSHMECAAGALGGGSENVLGMTSAEYGAAAGRLGLRYGIAGAHERYARLFREGAAGWAAGDSSQFAVHSAQRGREGRLGEGAPGLYVAPIARMIASESDEGRVLKFTQRVAGRSAGETLETESVIIPM